MQAERWTRVRQLFEAALDQEAQERERFVRTACGEDGELAAEVLGLLRADAREEAEAPLAGQDLAGGTIAGFRILRQIGEGGMGAVWAAQQERPQRTVALKTLTARFPSERARRRFEDEAEILARLRHPAIAQVLAAGACRIAAAEVPWFAMELVEDPRPIDRYAREERLDARRIATLFRTVCDAVHYAHQRGVIHRDLKPANVLVDRHGQPKVIDFGIARVADRNAAAHTRTGEILGTLAYMSPERLETGGDGDDTAADVYALGVILYELLAGQAPFPIDELPPARAVDVLRAHEPAPPSSVAPAAGIPAELDWITGKAIAKERGERYASVAELTQDLDRFLRDEPVAAGPPSATYRLRKLARRHRLLLSAAGIVFVALAAGLVIAAISLRKVEASLEQVTIAERDARHAERTARTAEAAARREAATLQAVHEFQQRILRGAYSSSKGRETRLADVVEAAAADLARTSFPDPVVEIGMRSSLGTSYLGLGLLAEGERQFLRARELLAALGPQGDPKWRIAISNNLGVCYEQMGRLEPAERELRAALEGQVELHGEDGEPTATTANNLASLLMKRAKPGEALELARHAQRTFARVHGEGSEQAVTAQAQAGQALAALGRDEEAAQAFDTALARASERLEPSHPARLGVLSVRAGHLQRQGRHVEAIAAWQEVAQAREQVLGTTHTDTLMAWNNLAASHLLRGEHAPAEAVFRRILEAREAAGIDAGFDYLVTGQNLTYAIRHQGRAAEAEVLARALREKARSSLPKEHWLIGVISKELGGCLRDLGRREEAEPLLLAAHELLATAVGPAHNHTQKTVAELVALYEAWQRAEEAARWRRKLVKPPS
jgi:tetratricopeptide (TPR) repeat protein